MVPASEVGSPNQLQAFATESETARWVGEGRGTKLGRAGVLAVCGLGFVLTSMAISQQLITNVRHRGLPYWAPERYVYGGLDLANYMRAAAWIKENTPSDAVIACRKPYQVYWITGRRAKMIWAESAEGVWEGFERLSEFGPVHVIEDAFGDRYSSRMLTETYWARTLGAHRERVEVLYRTGTPETVVWRVL